MDKRHTLHDEIRAENTHGRDTDTGLGGTVGGTQAREDNGAGAAHGTEEGLLLKLAFVLIESRNDDVSSKSSLGRVTSVAQGRQKN